MNKNQFNEIIKWQKETFPNATTMSKIEHLKEEIQELINDISIDSINKRLEFADCFMLLFGAAASSGMTYTDICIAIDQKMTINRSRNWGKPDEKGIVHHIKPENEKDSSLLYCDANGACSNKTPKGQCSKYVGFCNRQME